MSLNLIARMLMNWALKDSLYDHSRPIPSISIDLGKDEPGITLQYQQIERGYIVWCDYTVDGEAVKSPVDSGISNNRFAD